MGRPTQRDALGAAVRRGLPSLRAQAPHVAAERAAAGGLNIIDGDVAYHLREGGHDILAYDWQRFMDFADKYFK